MEKDTMKTRLLVAGTLVAVSLAISGIDAGAAKGPKPIDAKKWDSLADAALAAMKQRAAELKMVGVAQVSYAEGDAVVGWRSKMAVVGQMKQNPSGGDKGSNFLAIAYTKAGEMADTLTDSGSGKRPPLTGEFGWPGGAIARVKSGYLIVSFSGGKGEDDYKVSQAGLAVLKDGLE
jgi:hypothetical protein